jgi:murein DD-endopeptidase MepM/ murein hydrolase activator NlpD
VVPSRPLAGVEGDAFGVDLAFWPVGDAGHWQSLVGIPLDTEPGAYRVSVRAAAADGATGTMTRRLNVVRGRFATRQLRVEADLAHPPASMADRITREAQAMAEVYARPRPERIWRGPFALPVPGVPTSAFGRRTVLNGEVRGRHFGVDLRADEGAPVLAPNAGEVVLAADHYFAGKVVVLDHGGGLFSLYAHLSRIVVEAGRRVVRGDLLGEAGATGRVTGPHLHWGLRVQGTAVDPLSLVAALDGFDEPALDAR